MSRTTARLSTSPVAITACAMRKMRKVCTFSVKIVPSVASRNNATEPSITARRP